MVLDAVGAVRLARKDFGILGGSRHNSWFNELRRATLANSVDIDLEIEGWLADAGSQRRKDDGVGVRALDSTEAQPPGVRETVLSAERAP